MMKKSECKWSTGEDSWWYILAKFLPCSPLVCCRNIFRHRREAAGCTGRCVQHTFMPSLQKEKGHPMWHANVTTCTVNVFLGQKITNTSNSQDSKEKGFHHVGGFDSNISKPDLWSCPSATLWTQMCSSPAAQGSTELGHGSAAAYVWSRTLMKRACVLHQRSLRKNTARLWCSSSKPVGLKRQLRTAEMEAHGL